MVSTRSFKYKFSIGEKVLCYEPDLTKAKVLYDSKVMEIIEAKDRKGKKVVEYLIHFNGWNSSWDRRVNENFVLKDTDVNRQLQKDLADKSQLQIGAYLYRKDRKKRSRLMSGGSTEPKQKFCGSSEDGSSCSTATAGGREDCDETMTTEGGLGLSPGDLDTESYSSSAESNIEDDRVFLQVSEKFKNMMEHDFNQITQNNKLVDLPAKLSVLTILESYVKHVSIQSVLAPLQPEVPRRRNSAAKTDKREKDYGKIGNNISLRKEVADGLRLYFDFTVRDYLLYKEEKDQANEFLSDEFLSNFVYESNEQQSMDILCVKHETQTIAETTENPAPVIDINENNSRRRLRSYKTEENDNILLDIGKQEGNSISSVGSGSGSGNSTPHGNIVASATLNILKNLLPPNVGVSSKVKNVVQDILAWHMLSSHSPAEPSMIYGAIHLARFIIKLPDFLNASSISDEKLKLLLSHLDSFIEYLEEHPEWFSDDNYKNKNTIIKMDMDVEEIAMKKSKSLLDKKSVDFATIKCDSPKQVPDNAECKDEKVTESN